MEAGSKASGEDSSQTGAPGLEVSGGSPLHGAVLVKEEIRDYSTKRTPSLIQPLDEEQLKPASYHLSVGGCCRIMGDDRILTETDRYLRIPPFGVAIVSTFEVLNIPNFLIARWNLRVQRVYDGLIWTGSLQVDPGYSGHLFCPIFNLSTKTVTLEYREPVFTIDFVRTTRETEPRKVERKTRSLEGLEALDRTRLRSGIGEIDDRIREFEGRLRSSQHVMLIVLSIIVAAVAAIASVTAFGRFEVANCWLASFILSAVAVGIGTWALIRTFLARNKRKQ